jgi:hypothetical protein
MDDIFCGQAGLAFFVNNPQTMICAQHLALIGEGGDHEVP